MSDRKHGEKIWREFHKNKFPGIVVGSEQYNMMRHCFFVGMWASLGIMQKTPESLVDRVFGNLHAEIKGELVQLPDKRIISLN